VIWQVLHRAVPRSGGMVAIDPDGHVELTFNTPGMYRGWIDENARATVAIYGGRSAGE
jgi:beta-aspartyl-peptidase (threonine type)